jgi:transposase
MSRQATPVELTDEERSTLESWVRAPSTQHRYVRRAQMILRAAAGQATKVIAEALGVTAGTVSLWRGRFAQERLAGLMDQPRSGRPAVYDAATERRVLAQIDQRPPEGHATWTGDLVAAALGDVSADQVWRVLRAQGIHLQRRHSWCISTDPEFTAKAADVVGLYLAPPENAVVICVDEKTGVQALERAQGYLRLPNGRAITGFAHEYKRHGTTTLFAALEVATGLVQAGHYKRRRRREFLDFMNEVVAQHDPGLELHVVLDNLNTHKPKHDRWLRQHPNVHFHFTPTRASWLNQVEVWFSILARRALRGASFTSPRQVRHAIDQFIAAYNPTAAPFEWKKQVVHPSTPKRYYADLRN